ncbi:MULTISPECIES: UDP-glucose 4-epimerase GalE [unclassified Variovorax]|jgi:UDP-glucose 4-epimerase|uniref:UDP-glucose 4-epimerase GalE n=1 Tax=unclassified Variovorax TaxID=663243 RepID=UPI000F7E0EAC|nr:MULTISPECIES: UDP-glucose 4-epimerase GalE [unclassified Variovorax]RSZ31140.1 UDP-glucose 4-epimerase GalE [Variovorax sp. 553]RSZ31553.1 UDP-glucose 4-epimerase GalE [Variovorax sp. 679]
MRSCILVTGGAGFIGSHTCVALSASGYAPLILDNLANADPGVVERLGRITGRAHRCIRGDVRDRALLDRLFREERIEGVIHLGGLKVLGDSLSDPIACHENNVVGSFTLIAAMRAAGVKNLIFASSATVYGSPDASPILESAVCRPASPYGRAKRVMEQALTALCLTDPEWSVTVLRYFNPAGAHESGWIGEFPHGKPLHLVPAACQVAAGLRQAFMVQGSDYPTRDGTTIRDYVHVMDIAQAHVLALDHMQRRGGLGTFNLGTGKGHSVLDVVQAVERASGRQVACEFGPRRTGDVPACWADSSLAFAVLGWVAQRDLDTICEDNWRWQGSGHCWPTTDLARNTSADQELIAYAERCWLE